ncbi:MAG: hypothetical protein ICV73_20365 [Acetobacteraceae bacterium]|nr:hypothetical protein [Acetobacteraceae bacterium]
MPNERLDQLLRAELLLSLQRALVGAVPASLRAVTCDWTEARITLRYVFDGPIDHEDEESMRVVGAQVVADFPPDVELDEQIVRSDHPAGLTPHFLRAWAYMRKEGPTEDGHRRLLVGA